MKFAYSIMYVSDVPATVNFYERAFGIPCRSLHESKLYAEMGAEDVVLTFVDQSAAPITKVGFKFSAPGEPLLGTKITFLTDDVLSAFQRALDEGAIPIEAPSPKPWGRTIAHLSDFNGALVELCST